MERYQQQFLKQITMADWNARAHPDVPALPWRADSGEEVRSFTVVPLEHTGGLLIVLFDADGREVVRSGDVHAIEATALALVAAPGDVMLLPR
jgi:hypothetical protein